MPEPKPCEHCGQPIVGRMTRAKFCSRKCCLEFDKARANAKRRERRELRDLSRECKACGKVFEPKRKNTIFCSRDCCIKGTTLRKAALKGVPPTGLVKRCDVCLVKFTTRKPIQKYCGAKCRNYASNSIRDQIGNQQIRLSPEIIAKRTAAVRAGALAELERREIDHAEIPSEGNEFETDELYVAETDGPATRGAQRRTRRKACCAGAEGPGKTG